MTQSRNKYWDLFDKKRKIQIAGYIKSELWNNDRSIYFDIKTLLLKDSRKSFGLFRKWLNDKKDSNFTDYDINDFLPYILDKSIAKLGIYPLYIEIFTLIFGKSGQVKAHKHRDIPIKTKKIIKEASVYSFSAEYK